MFMIGMQNLKHAFVTGVLSFTMISGKCLSRAIQLSAERYTVFSEEAKASV